MKIEYPGVDAVEISTHEHLDANRVEVRAVFRAYGVTSLDTESFQRLSQRQSEDLLAESSRSAIKALVLSVEEWLTKTKTVVG